MFEDARCIGLSGLFDSMDHWQHQDAAAECAKCPAFEACERLLDEVQSQVSDHYREVGAGATGTWAGRLIGKSSVATRAACGEERGYHQHKRNGEDPCDDCFEAHAIAETARYSRRRAREMGDAS